MDNISKKSFTFLEELKNNNNREWFNQNKDRYLQIKSELKFFSEKLFWKINDFDENLQLPDQKPYLFRIHKDARFSKWVPYKTHYWILISQGSKPFMHLRPGYYLHLEPWNNFFVAWVWSPEPQFLKSIRKNIDENFTEFLQIINEKNFKNNFTISWKRLKTQPKWYSKDNKAIEYLKYKDFFAITHFDDSQVFDKNFLEFLTFLAKTAHPFIDFLYKWVVYTDEKKELEDFL